MKQKTRFYSSRDANNAAAPQKPRRFTSAGTKDVLTGADSPLSKSAQPKRNGKKGNYQEFRMSSESDSFFDIARSVGDNHSTLSQYVIGVIGLFRRVEACSIYLADKIAGHDDESQERTILRHRISVARMKDGSFRTRNVDSQHSITRSTQKELVAFIQRKPTVYNFRKGFKLIYRNLQRGNRRFDTESHARRPERNEMVAQIPIIYRQKAIGLLAIEGNLDIALDEPGHFIMSRIKQNLEGLSTMAKNIAGKSQDADVACGIIEKIRSDVAELQSAVPELADEESGLETRRAARAGAMGIAIGSVLGEKLITKFGGVTELTGKEDFRIDLEDSLKKLEAGKLRTLFVLMIDLDHFKATNDTYGHLKGDVLLRKVADILKESVRTKAKRPEKSAQEKEESARQKEAACLQGEQGPLAERRSNKDDEQKETETDNVFRWGGEEFTILLRDVSAELALKIAKRINRAISEIHIVLEPGNDLVKVNGEWIPAPDGEVIRTTCSIGAVDVAAVLAGRKFKTVKSRAGFVVETADNLMYKAKEEGRNRIYFAQSLNGKLETSEYKNGPGQSSSKDSASQHNADKTSA